MKIFLLFIALIITRDSISQNLFKIIFKKDSVNIKKYDINERKFINYDDFIMKNSASSLINILGYPEHDLIRIENKSEKNKINWLAEDSCNIKKYIIYNIQKKEFYFPNQYSTTTFYYNNVYVDYTCKNEVYINNTRDENLTSEREKTIFSGLSLFFNRGVFFYYVFRSEQNNIKDTIHIWRLDTEKMITELIYVSDKYNLLDKYGLFMKSGKNYFEILPLFIDKKNSNDFIYNGLWYRDYFPNMADQFKEYYLNTNLYKSYKVLSSKGAPYLIIYKNKNYDVFIKDNFISIELNNKIIFSEECVDCEYAVVNNPK